jgi:hypothetical protein
VLSLKGSRGILLEHPTWQGALTGAQGAVRRADFLEVLLGWHPQVCRLQVGMVLLAQAPPLLLDLQAGMAARKSLWTQEGAGAFDWCRGSP